MGKMLISLLLIVVPTVLILAILIPFINSRSKRVMDELGALKTQLEQLGNVSVPAAEKTSAEPDYPEPPVQADDDNEEEQDAEMDAAADIPASPYNTGKSGKTYTKEELELLIKE